MLIFESAWERAEAC